MDNTNIKDEVLAEVRTLIAKTQEDARKADEEKRSLQDKLDAEVRAREAREATYAADNPANQARANAQTGVEWREIAKAMVEKRAITVNGTGAVNLVSEIVRDLVKSVGYIDKFKKFTGAAYNTSIPVLSPSIAVPAGQSEGATSVAADSTAALGVKTLNPKSHISILPVTGEALLMSGANIEAQLSAIFAEAFAKNIGAESLTGTGLGNFMEGMFTASGNQVLCAAAGAPTLSDYFNLAMTVKEYSENAAIWTNRNLFTAAISAAAKDDPLLFEYLTKSTIHGVPVIATGYAPTEVTESAVVAVAMEYSNYALGVAQELKITPINERGSDITYFQATMYYDGKVINPSNCWQLVADGSDS